MLGRPNLVARDVDADREVAEVGHPEIHGIADCQSARRDRRGRQPVECKRPVRSRRDRCTRTAQRHMRRADHQWTGAERVRQAHAHPLAAYAHSHDLANGLAFELDGFACGLRACSPCAHPVDVTCAVLGNGRRRDGHARDGQHRPGKHGEPPPENRSGKPGPKGES